MQGIHPSLWSAFQAEEAARFYTEDFEVLGQRILGLNGGPAFTT